MDAFDYVPRFLRGRLIIFFVAPFGKGAWGA